MILVAMLLLIKVRRYLSKVTFFIKDLKHLNHYQTKKNNGLLECGMQHGCALTVSAFIMIARRILLENISLGIFQLNVKKQKLPTIKAATDGTHGKWIDLSMSMAALHVNQSRSLRG